MVEALGAGGDTHPGSRLQIEERVMQRERMGDRQLPIGMLDDTEQEEGRVRENQSEEET